MLIARQKDGAVSQNNIDTTLLHYTLIFGDLDDVGHDAWRMELGKQY